MALFRVRTGAGSDFNWSSQSQEKPDRELMDEMVRILNEMSKDQPDSQIIRVQVLDRNW